MVKKMLLNCFRKEVRITIGARADPGDTVRERTPVSVSLPSAVLHHLDEPSVLGI